MPVDQIPLRTRAAAVLTPPGEAVAVQREVPLPRSWQSADLDELPATVHAEYPLPTSLQASPTTSWTAPQPRPALEQHSQQVVLPPDQPRVEVLALLSSLASDPEQPE